MAVYHATSCAPTIGMGGSTPPCAGCHMTGGSPYACRPVTGPRRPRRKGGKVRVCPGQDSGNVYNAAMPETAPWRACAKRYCAGVAPRGHSRRRPKPGSGYTSGICRARGSRLPAAAPHIPGGSCVPRPTRLYGLVKAAKTIFPPAIRSGGSSPKC